MPDRQADWDIFCTVIDNYGDIGVCWRLARQLALEHGATVRLWVDALDAFARICPQVEVGLDVQTVDTVEVRAWCGDFAAVEPARFVIETFACHLPERYVEAMAEMSKRPVWINLDYLSAESWTAACHALPSPHPRLPLVKYFFFPGFAENSGGLLRERDLLRRRDEFSASSALQDEFWQPIGGRPANQALIVSLFAYANAGLSALLDVWQASERAVCCLAPLTRGLPELKAWAGRELRQGEVIRRGALEVRVLPFFEQHAYDRLLWACDLNLVRGEDSFVRAQWAGKPLLWHIYPQDEAAHEIKLAAFLDLYCAELSPAAGSSVRALHTAWNGDAQRIDAPLWHRWLSVLPELQSHAERWCDALAERQDLCSQLVRFCRSKL